MAPRIGTTLVRCALGPVNYAGSLIVASRVPEGLKELSPESLHGGLKRGIEETAKLAGMRPQEVEAMLPAYEIRVAVTSLTLTQKAAADAWNTHAGQIGGLLQGVADLTVDGRVPDVPLCLERLAQKVSRDKAFAEPLRALSGDIARWQEVVAHCRRILDDGGALARAYRKRRLRTIAMGVALGLAISAVAFVIIRIRTAHARVEARLTAAKADPCALMALSESEISGGTADQRRRVGEGRTECEARRAQEVRAREERERREAAERSEREKRKKHEAACTLLAAHVQSGELTAADETIAGPASELLGRISKNTLQPTDLGPDDPKLPCADAPEAQKKLKKAFATAVLSSQWIGVERFSTEVETALATHAAALRDAQRQIFGRRADATAKRAILSGNAELLANAKRLCRLADKLDAPGRAFCPAALALGDK
jgi:hypothetical protein